MEISEFLLTNTTLFCSSHKKILDVFSFLITYFFLLDMMNNALFSKMIQNHLLSLLVNGNNK